MSTSFRTLFHFHALLAFIFVFSTMKSVQALDAVEMMGDVQIAGAGIKAALRNSLANEEKVSSGSMCQYTFTTPGALIPGAPKTQPEQADFMLNWCQDLCPQNYCPFLELTDYNPNSTTTDYTCVCKGESLPSPSAAPTQAPTVHNVTSKPTTGSASGERGTAVILSAVVIIGMAILG